MDLPGNQKADERKVLSTQSLLANTWREDDKSRMSLAPNPHGNENECLANS